MAMNTYEICIIAEGAKAAAIYSSFHISDYAAVRRAQALASDSAMIEVWRGATCVYSGAPKHALAS